MNIKIISFKTLILVALTNAPLTAANAENTERAKLQKTPLRPCPRIFHGRRISKVKTKRVTHKRPRRVRAPRRRQYAPPPKLGPPQSTGWGHGEAITYAIKLLGVEGGRAAISVGKPGKKNGRRAIFLSGLGETAPFISAVAHLRERVKTLVALDGLYPLNSTANRTTPGKERDIEVTFGHRVRQVIKKKGETRIRNRRISPPPFDPISALFALRTRPLKKGQKLSMNVLSGTSLYALELKVVGGERLYLKRTKPAEALRVDGVARRISDQGHLLKHKPPRKLSIWFSADDARIPLKLIGDTELGPLEAQLSSYHAPPAGTLVRVREIAQRIKISAFGTRR